MSDLNFIYMYKVRKAIKFMIIQNIDFKHFSTKEMGASRKKNKNKNTFLIFRNNNKINKFIIIVFNKNNNNFFS